MIELRQIRSRARNLLALWLKEWQAVLPDALRGSTGSGRSSRIVIRPDDERVTIAHQAADGTQLSVQYCRWVDYNREFFDRVRQDAVATLRNARTDIVLSLPHAITGALVVPQQARARAGSIVRDHVARKIPMKVESLFIGHEVREASGKIELRYLILPKDKLEQILTKLSLDLSELDALESTSPAHATAGTVSFTRARSAHARWMTRAVTSLVMVAIAAPVVSYGASAWRQHSTLTELDAQIAALTVQARRSTEQLKTVYGMVDDLDRLAAIRAAPGITQIWEELARLLPDSTYLKEVEIKGDEVHMTGFSNAAADLIHSFEASPMLHAASFTGPVVFDRAEAKEHFTLRAVTRQQRLPSEERE